MKKIKLIMFTTILALVFFVSCSGGSGSSRIKPPKLTVQTNGKNPFIIIQNNTNVNQAVDSNSSNSNFLPVQNYIADMERQGKKILISKERPEIRINTKALENYKLQNRFNKNQQLIQNKTSNVNYLIDDTHQFYTEGPTQGTTKPISGEAVLKAIGDHCYVWYVEKTAIDLDETTVFNDVKETFDNIFNYETYIFGENTSSNINLGNVFIPVDSYPKIHIIIYDLQDDYEKNPTVVEGGYFWSLDMLSNTYIQNSDDNNLTGRTSNECECIHIDSGVLLDNPEQAYSTLAHEFQHLLNFVNKVLNTMDSKFYSLPPATWYNEMMSMVCEDIMQDKLPGVTAADGPQSRMSLFNSTFQYGFTNWYSGNDVLVSYANAYAFGAFLIRNYGINCIKEIAHNGYVNETSVLKAVQNYDNADPISNFTELLQKFYNVMLSPEGNYYNLNKSVSETYNIPDITDPVTFTCAAINLNSYATISAQEMTYDVASKLYNGVAGRTYYGPVILENTYYLDIAPKGTCIIHIPQSYSSVSIPGEWSDYLNYYIELK